MDIIMKELIKLSDEYCEMKRKYFTYSDNIKKPFHLSSGEEYLVAFGILKSDDPVLQGYLDILNSDKNFKKMSKRLSKKKLQSIIKVLQYAIECEVNIPGYDIRKLLTHPSKNREEIITLFEGLAGADNIYIIRGKTMLEIPARAYVTENRRLLKYVDFLFKKMNQFWN